MLETRHLAVFASVVRTGTFAGAARELGYTQPAISQQMRALERALKTTLFVRSGRGLKLSRQGRVLADHVPDLLSELSSVVEHVAAVQRLQDGLLRVCSFPSANATLLPTAMAQMREQHSSIEIELFEAEPPQSIEGVRSGEYDVAISFQYEDDDDSDLSEDLVSMELASEPLVLLAPETHPITRQRQVRLEDLEGERWIAGCQRCRQEFVKACESAGYSPQIDITTDDTLAVQSYVVAGLGLAVMPRMTQEFVHHPKLRVRQISPERHRTVLATVMQENVRTPAVQIFVRQLREAADRLAAEREL